MLTVTEAPSVRQAPVEKQYSHVPYPVKGEHHGGKNSPSSMTRRPMIQFKMGKIFEQTLPQGWTDGEEIHET